MENIITKKEFLKDVAHEVRMLKKHATPEEIKRLELRLLEPTSVTNCIYGQLTGNCQSKRAKELMDLSCKRVWTGISGTTVLTDGTVEENLGFVNGDYKGQTWVRENPEWWNAGGCEIDRKWSYLSALEGYIACYGAKNANVIAFLKGEMKRLVL